MVDGLVLPESVECVIPALAVDSSVQEIWLIGSRVSGTANTDSDWDLLVMSAREPASADARENKVDVLWRGPSGRILLEGQHEEMTIDFRDFRWCETDGRATYCGRKSRDVPDGVGYDTSTSLDYFVTCKGIRIWKRSDHVS